MKLTMFAPGLLVLAALTAQDNGRHGTVQRVHVHGKALEGNLEGDSPDRDVAVYLPPSYNSTPGKSYPVLYLLHGFTDDVDHWWGVTPHFVSVPDAMDKALANGVSEMIIVMPNAFTRYQGSMYANSATVGDWEDFVANELVSYIDHHYRTVASAAGRGLAGHSMGGYGTMRIGMKRPGVFSSLYLMSPCCMDSSTIHPSAAAEAIHDPAEVQKADFFTKAAFASAAAWSPNPKNGPLFLDLPYRNGAVLPEIAAKWSANATLAVIDQYIPNLRTYKAIAMDVGTKDSFIAPTVKTLDAVLTAYGIRHTYETYEGDHVNHIGERLQKNVLPFFAANLKQGAP